MKSFNRRSIYRFNRDDSYYRAWTRTDMYTCLGYYMLHASSSTVHRIKYIREHKCTYYRRYTEIYICRGVGVPQCPHYSHLHANWVRIYTHILLFCVISLDQHTSKELLYQIKDITGRPPLLLMISLWQIYPLLCDRLIKGFL